MILDKEKVILACNNESYADTENETINYELDKILALQQKYIGGDNA